MSQTVQPAPTARFFAAVLLLLGFTAQAQVPVKPSAALPDAAFPASALASAAPKPASGRPDTSASLLGGVTLEVSVAPTAVAVAEEGTTTDTFVVALSQTPATNVTLQLTFDAQVQLDTGSGFGASPQTVTLTPANAMTGITITVRAEDDAFDEDDLHSVVITTSDTSSATPEFNGLPVPDVTVTVADDDTAGIVITRHPFGGTAVTEGSTTGSYTIVLGSQPTDTVNAFIQFDSAQLVVAGETDGTYSANFTALDWNMPQFISIVAVDDVLLEGDHEQFLLHNFSSNDPDYNGAVAQIDGSVSSNALSVPITDNESAMLEWAATSGSSAEGEDASAFVRLRLVSNGTPGGLLAGSIDYAVQFTAGSASAADVNLNVVTANFSGGASDQATSPEVASHVPDSLVEGSETYSLGISLVSASPGMDVTVAPTPFTGTIIDGDAATVSLSGGAAVAESAGSTSLTATLNTAPGNTLAAPVTLLVDLIDGTATHAGGSGDFSFAGSANSVEVGFPAGSGDGTTLPLDVAIQGDRLVEGEENFSAALTVLSGAASVSGSALALNIVDDDIATLRFATPGSSVNEANSPHLVTAVMDIQAIGLGASELALPVTAAVVATPGGAQTPADYNLDTTSLIFAAGTPPGATQPISISIVDNAISEPDEDFSLGFDGVTGPATAPDSHVVSIINDDIAAVHITQSDSSTAVSEAGATDSYSIVLGSEPTATVDLAISFPANQVVLNGDFDGTLNTSFTAANWDVPQTITVSALNDRTLEGDHTALLVHSFSSSDPDYDATTALIDGSTSGNALDVAITDNESAVLEWAPGSDSAAEGMNAVTAVRLDITANPAGGTPTLGGTISYNAVFSAGTASAADVGTIFGSTSFTNAFDLATNSLTVLHLPDALVEGSESYSLAISLTSLPPGMDVTVAPTPFTGTILDGDAATVSLSGGANMAESAGSTPLTLTLSTGAGNTLEAPVTVAVNLIDGSATYASGTGDFFFAGPSNTVDVVFPAGSGDGATQQVAVSIRSDRLVEDEEDFAAALGTATGAANVSGTAQTITIIDDDVATLRFAMPGSTANEGSTPHVVSAVMGIEAIGTGPTELALAVTASAVQTPGSAQTPSDYILDTTSLSFPMGTPAGAMQPISISIIDNAISEPDEEFSLAFDAVTGPATAPESHVVSILDNDVAGAVLAQSQGSTVLDEAGGSDTYTVALTSEPLFDVNIEVTADAQLGAAPTTLVFTPADWNVAQAVTLTAIDDAIVEGEHSGAVSHTLSSADPMYDALAVAGITATISDNDTAGVILVASDGNTVVTEAGGTDTYTVALSSEPTAAVTVDLITSPQLDASPSSLVFSAANWNSPQTITLGAVDDSVVEGTHQASIGHTTSSDDPNYSAISVVALEAEITDNDSATAGFAPIGVSQSESVGAMVFTVTLSNPVQSGATLSISSAPGTATAADFIPILAGSVTFPPLVTSQTVSVVISDDALHEADESFTLTLADLVATGEVTLGDAVATGTIVDDDPAPTLVISNPIQPEGDTDNTMEFVASLSAISGLDVSFIRETADGTATANSDYEPLAPAPVTIAAGELSVVIPVVIRGDAVYEGDESFSLSLTAISNAAPSGVTGTGTIEEDDQQPTTSTISAVVPSPSVVGQPYTVTVIVSAVTLSPPGEVMISNGSDSCGPIALTAGTAPDSSASCELTSNNAGTKTITVDYTPGSGAFIASVGSQTHQVNPAATSISVSGPPRSRINQPASFGFTLQAAAPGGDVPSGVVTLSSPDASCDVPVPTSTPSCDLVWDALGARQVLASYVPDDDDHLASSTDTLEAAQTMVFALADLQLTKTAAVNTHGDGDLMVYTITLRNLGSDTAEDLLLKDTVPAGLVDVLWTCQASGGAGCPQISGAGDLSLAVPNLPVGGLLTISFSGNVAGNPPQISNTAGVGLPTDGRVEDADLANNNATAVSYLEGVFSNGFETHLVKSSHGSFAMPSSDLVTLLDEAARLVFVLDDAHGDAAHIYARLRAGRIEYALAGLDGAGRLRLGEWKAISGDPQFSWTARETDRGWRVDQVDLR